MNFVFENVMCKVKHLFPGLYTHGTEAVLHIRNATVYTWRLLTTAEDLSL